MLHVYRLSLTRGFVNGGYFKQCKSPGRGEDQHISVKHVRQGNTLRVSTNVGISVMLDCWNVGDTPKKYTQ